jgi:hypothetical protein
VSYAISLSGTTVSIASPGPRGVGVPTGGTTGQVLKKSSNTDYDFAWGAETAGLASVADDDSPQLGANLDVNGFSIVSVSNGNIAVTPNGTGSLILDGLTWPSVDGTANQVLKTAGNGTLSFGDASVVATTLDLTDTPASYGTAGEVLALNSGASAFEFVANVASGAYTLDTLGTVAEGSITDVVALTSTQYADIASPDSKTLFVITDGTTSIADSDDVTITAAATNDFLIYTGSVWEDQTPAQARTALGLGTLATASTITDSYVGHIETIADGTYYIDVRVPAGRTLTSFYIAADSGASATVDLQEGGVSMLSATASLTGGTPLEILTSATTPTISDTALAADAVLTIVLSGSSSGDNFRFAVEYTQ